MKILIASNNQNKIIEFKRILTNIELLTPVSVGIEIDPDETGHTLEDNAKIKAEEFWKAIKSEGLDIDAVISDDTGVYLEEFPDLIGVKANRWYPGASEDRNKKVLELLENKENRTIYYRTVLCYKDNAETQLFDGFVYGEVSKEIKGGSGFAYDYIFKLPSGKTISELSSEVKDKISSRGIAAIKVYDHIKEKLGL